MGQRCTALGQNRTAATLFWGGYGASYGIGYLSYMLSPVVIGSAAVGLGLDAGQTGLLATAELFTFALTMLVAAPRIDRVSRRKLALIGAGLAFIGHAGSALAGGYGLLIIARVVAGIGLGLLVAAGNATIASAADPQKLFARVFTLGQLLAAALLFFVVPEFIDRWSFHGSYGLLAVLVLLMLPLVMMLPDRTPTAQDDSHGPGTSWRLFIMPTVLAMALIGASDGSIWTFTERIAANLGMNTQQAGNVLAVSLIAGVAGAALSTLVGTRWGTRMPIAAGGALLAGAYFVVATTNSPMLYTVFQIGAIGVFGFFLPYLYGINGRLDASGRIMVAGSGAHVIGMGIGPAVAGQVVMMSGYAGMGTLVFIMTLICAGTFWFTLAGKR